MTSFPRSSPHPIACFHDPELALRAVGLDSRTVLIQSNPLDAPDSGGGGLFSAVPRAIQSARATMKRSLVDEVGSDLTSFLIMHTVLVSAAKIGPAVLTLHSRA
jgi:hypothetical protein